MQSTAIEDGLNVAVLIPCHNQAATIGGIVQGFSDTLPSARIFVFDNNSTDDTARAAAHAGALVYREARQGKGNVVRRMFADVDADVYVLADGDGSYDPADAPSLVNALITERVDMVVGTRCGRGGVRGKRSLGARLFDWLYRRVFGEASSDVLSGYRAFTRRFVRSFPAISSGFDIEVELSMHASQLMVPVAEIDLADARRGIGIANASSATMRMVRMAAMLARETRPFAFYATLAVIFWALGLFLMPPFGGAEAAPAQASTGAAAGMTMLMAGFVLAACGLILDALGRARIEQKRILFLTIPALGAQ